jgi:hypothetical protein
MYPPFGVPNAGEVKLDTNIKDAEVFINGYYAGTVGQLKTMTMRAGNYSLEIRAPGRYNRAWLRACSRNRMRVSL